MKLEFVMQLNSEELRLIVAALHGGLKEDQIQPALDLQKRIVEMRATKLKTMYEQAQNQKTKFSWKR